MMDAFFASAERQAQLRAEATSWLNTPFCARAAVKGAGVDCVRLTAELMVACGLIRGYEFPRYSLDWARHRDRSIVLEWLAACPQVALVPDGEPAQIGDVVGFKVGRCVHHVGVVLDPPLFINAIEGARVSISQLNDSTWAKRLACLYRPLNR